MVRETDSPEYALREMKNNGVSTAYVVGRHMKFLGIVNVESAIRARKEEKSLKEVYVTDVETTTRDTVISDILPIAAEAKYPIAVLEGGWKSCRYRFQGIGTVFSDVTLKKTLRQDKDGVKTELR